MHRALRKPGRRGSQLPQRCHTHKSQGQAVTYVMKATELLVHRKGTKRVGLRRSVWAHGDAGYDLLEMEMENS